MSIARNAPCFSPVLCRFFCLLAWSTGLVAASYRTSSACSVKLRSTASSLAPAEMAVCEKALFSSGELLRCYSSVNVIVTVASSPSSTVSSTVFVADAVFEAVVIVISQSPAYAASSSS